MPEPTPHSWTVRIDARDVLGAAGVLMMVGGLAFIHVGLAASALGLGLFGLAWKLSR